MGIGFVLLIWAVVGIVLAGTGALVLRCTAAYLTRGAQRGRKTLILATSLFPFACLGWAAAVFAFQAIINEAVPHRDAGLGDTWSCPLPNGYALLMIDTTDQGFVYNPKIQLDGGVAEQEDAIAAVRLVQIAGRYIHGGSDSRAFERLENRGQQVDSYFLLDTQTGTHTNYPSYEALRSKALELGIALSLERIDTIYGRYRYTRFEVFVGLLLCLPPLVGAVLLVRWIIRVRKTRGMDLSAA
jgi:hypothetical protein